jgi:hypothetical protein
MKDNDRAELCAGEWGRGADSILAVIAKRRCAGQPIQQGIIDAIETKGLCSLSFPL